MFNTSTLISLGLTALLCGIIMFYCKRKFAEYEQKLDVMSDLISNIITQLNQIPSSVYDNSGFEEQHNVHMSMNTMPMSMPMNTAVYEESDADESDVEGENEEVETSNNDKRIIVTLPNVFNNDTTENDKQLNEEDLDDESWDSQEEDDDDDDAEHEQNHKITIQPDVIDMVIDSVNLEQNKIEEVNEATVEEVNEATVEESKSQEAQSEEPQSEEIKVVDTSSHVDIDYNKMQVAMLKKMVAERNLAQGVSKMKKQELVNVLMKQ